MRRRPAPCRLLWAVLLPALAALAVLPAPCAARDDADRVAAAAERWLERRLGRRPDLAVRLGAWDPRARAGDRARALTTTDTTWIAALEGELRAIPAARLPAEAALDRDLLLARLLEDRLELVVERPFARDPGRPIPRIEGAVRATLEDPSRSPPTRAERAAAWLSAVREALRAALAAMREPGRDETAEAAARARAFAHVLREGVPGYVEARAPEPLARLAEADSDAVRALEAFADHLEVDVLPLATPTPPPGADAVHARLEVWRSRATAGSLLARARREIAAHRLAMERAATSIVGTPDVAAALAALAADAVPADSLPVIAEAIFEHQRRAVLERRLLPGELAARVPLERAAWSDDAHGVVRLVTSGVWNDGKARGALRLIARRAPGVTRVPRTALVLDVAAAGVPGRWSAELARRRAPSRLRQALTLGWMDDGWALYARRLAAEIATGPGAERVELAWRAGETRALARAAAHLALATGENPDSVAAQLEDAGVAPVGSGHDAAWRAARDPSALTDVLVMWRVLDLRARAITPPRLDRLHQAVLELGLPLASTTGVAVPGVHESPSR